MSVERLPTGRGPMSVRVLDILTGSDGDSLPHPVLTGTDTYYRARGADFARRHPNRRQPSYYLDYGDKCLHQFRAVGPDLSRGGQAWLESTLRLLQEAIEERRRQDPIEFERLELDDHGFQDFAFSTHAQAYIDGGIFTLPADDLWRILKTPDMTDVVSREGIAEILVLLAKLHRHDLTHIVSQTCNRDPQQGPSRFLGWIVRHARQPKSAALEQARRVASEVASIPLALTLPARWPNDRDPGPVRSVSPDVA